MSETLIPGGLLVAIEGIDGSGKTTLASWLGATLDAAAVPCVISKEPTRGPWGMRLRDSAATGRLSPQEELDLLLLDRQQHVAELIQPALNAGKIVVLDRYYPSNAAYQGAEGLDVDDILTRNDFAPSPDVVLLLDLDPRQGLERIRARGDVPNHFETEAALVKCREIFLNMSIDHRVVVDASASIEDVRRQCWQAIVQAITEKSTQPDGMAPPLLERLQNMELGTNH